MECTALGTVPAEHLDDIRERLAGLAGLPGRDAHLHELVLRSCIPDRPELHLQHSTPGPGGGGGPHRWTATQYRLPLEGRASGGLPATVRSVARTACRGPDVLGFWRALGFSVQHQMLKRGVAYEVEHGGHMIQVVVCRVHRLPTQAAQQQQQQQQPQGGELAGEDIAPGHWLVEATTAVEGGAYAEAAAALGSLSKLLAPFTALQPLPAGRGRPRPPP